MKKAALRKEFLQKRKEADGQWLVEKNALIAQNLKKYVQQNHFKTLHTFLPQLGSREIDTFLVIESLRIAFPTIRIAAPYIIPGTREMEHYLVSPFTHLITNQWRIPEPDPLTSERVQPQELDMVLVPLLAFDRSGYRVGYGGGYYDRFLPHTRPDCIKIGLSLFDAVEEIADLDQYDFPLDVCITPEHVYHFNKQ
ncbi:MAG: 5-formyltetrahydrofolate cyclo-ligase [Dyadobacter sp. 50-39]|uniref:5-formyltetrahydrofolate cyclo-ligase n=1 Tax=Dyadobacter sp. 50-39 TaxID=1895756 RepID=UPI00095B66B0|nr:5-formyltetrahydrofolate cyclo-ligase [Dyadobacter sp. 50-39]OJV18635.1 MAG: 5-formyltetrahydrofolate cyclo-ligase [Dyadobacter sp. 50-39]